MNKEAIIDIENPKDNDLINRQAVLDLIVANHIELNGLNVVMYSPLYKDIMQLPSVKPQEPYDFAKWVASEIFDDMWEYNKDAFAEITCRKLAKLGIVRAKGNEWELIEPQESENKK